MFLYINTFKLLFFCNFNYCFDVYFWSFVANSCIFALVNEQIVIVFI